MEKRKQHLNPKLEQAGFSIVEVMIAMAIFSIGILAVWSMQLNAAKGNTRAQSVTYSSEWALGQVERLLVQGMGGTTAYNKLAPSSSLSQDVDGMDNDNDGEIDEGGENGSLWVLNKDADGVDNNYNGQIDENGEDGPLSVSLNIEEVSPDSTTDIYNYKIVTVTVTKTVGSETRTIVLENRVPNIV
ncbi:prepilin-type N-terminal cleavage/methylation domain-containing protein [Desulfosarcina ovata]|uniref:Prepilin-type N-terminal cleavage/methylation domain-containing protein n=1 Tax=Desulfosarcina ovata subsp. ovata TaxID=2752305 RepID=A0A5K8A4S0_9BACT|nr:prepilin-type N-terminal cleavage/methylation domain-containing protein [Desulfosarcina ovata]BBO87416.1 hypothetical protein DSCOOX_05960 [Desulfosarcina ovata subsp. ovata]